MHYRMIVYAKNILCNIFFKKRLIFIFFLSTTLCYSSCAQKDIFTAFTLEVNAEGYVDNRFTIDTIIENNIKYYVPKLNSKRFERLLFLDISNSRNDSSLIGAEVTYDIVHYSENFMSVIKNVYIKNDGSAKGYYSNDYGINMFIYNNKTYKVNISFDNQEISSALKAAANFNIIDSECLRENIKSVEYMQYCFKDGKLLIINPIEFPVCWNNIPIPFTTKNIEFSLE